MLSDQVTDLPLEIEGYEFDRRERETSSDFTRVSTVVSLHGDGETGQGEDVTYDAEAHDVFQDEPSSFPVPTVETFAEFATWAGEFDFFGGAEPGQAIFHNHRQWAFESAALDLALKQAETNLGEHLDREYEPVRFVVSTRLGDPPTGKRVLDWLERDSTLAFKLDPTSEWSDETVERLAATDAVRILDFKGQYEGTEVDQSPDPALYERIVEGFPEALLEDPALTSDTRPVFDGHEERVTWDHPIQSVESIRDLPWEPRWLNIKPSRFGSVRSLLDSIEYCLEHEIRMYGGGQFELDIGREHIHTLASLFYPDSPNDVAPKAYNDPNPTGGLPLSPLHPPDSPRGLSYS